MACVHMCFPVFHSVIGTGDQVQCFYCDGGLQNWEPDDDVWEEPLIPPWISYHLIGKLMPILTIAFLISHFMDTWAAMLKAITENDRIRKDNGGF